MKHRTREWVALTFAIISVAAGLSAIGIFLSQTIWKFDAAILGAFLLGDYPLRWVFRLRNSRTVVAITHLFHRRPTPSWTRLALASCWFFIIVLAVGELTYLVAIFTGVLYAEVIPSFVIVELSAVLSLWLSIDFREHYRKDLGAEDDFWENIVP